VVKSGDARGWGADESQKPKSGRGARIWPTQLRGLCVRLRRPIGGSVETGLEGGGGVRSCDDSGGA